MSIIFPYALPIAFFISAIAQIRLQKIAEQNSKHNESKFAGISAGVCFCLSLITAVFSLIF